MTLFTFTSGLLAAVLLLAVSPAEALRFMLDSVNDHYTPRGRCVLFKIPGHSLVTGKVSGIPPSNGRIGAYVSFWYFCVAQLIQNYFHLFQI